MKKIFPAVALMTATALSVSSCGSGKTYGYEVSGTVQEQRIEPDCDSHAMETVAFDAGRGTGGGSGARSGSSSKQGGGSGGGASLDKKPPEPKKLKGPKGLKDLNKSLKGCDRFEYEIIVLSGGELYEQDVRKEDYENCLKAATPEFPACTEG